MKTLSKINQKLAFLLIAILSFAACTDNNEIENPVNADATFMFETTQNLKLSVKVNDTYSAAYYYKVEIFDRHPLSKDTAAALLSAGVAKSNADFNTQIVVPNHITRLFVRQIDPLQRASVKIIDIDKTTKQLDIDFRPQTSSASAAKMAKVVAPNPKASDYTLPATYNTLSSAAVTLMGENNYIPANVTNSNINFGWLQNSAVYVAGELIVNTSGTYIPGNTKIVVLPGGKATFNTDINFEQNGVVVAVQAGATAVFNQNASVGQGSILVNDGTVTLAQAFEIRANSTVYNNATINAKNFTMTNQSTLHNDGALQTSEHFIMNSNTYFKNTGVITATASLRTNNTTAVIDNHNLIRTAYFDMLNGGGVLNNYCTVEATGAALSGSTTNGYPGTIFATTNLYALNATINLYGDAIFKTGVVSNLGTSSVANGVEFVYNVKIEGFTQNNKFPIFITKNLTNKNGWQVLELAGAMEFVLPAADVPGQYFFKNVAGSVSITELPTVTITSTGCNGGGVNADNGSGAPSNPNFPMWIEENNVYSYAMEDLWPHLGDYDMNDFVFTIKNIKKLINAENKVLSLSFDITPRAAGSTRLVNAALQFDNIAANNVTVSATDNKARMETGHTLANAILFENAHSLFGRSSQVITNTHGHLARIASKDYNFRFDFTQAVEAEKVIISALNFYVIVGEINSNNRNEVHLAGFAPTVKVSKATNNYKDSNNMIWALMLPVADFKYPTETTKIYDAYPQFSNWATSGGNSNANWYLFPSNNTSLIYYK